jgi:hypothetical protein
MAFSLSNLFKKPKQIINTSEIIDQIDYKEGTKFAENTSNKIYVDIEELGGFPYLKTVIIGDTQANIKRTGCTITFVFADEEFTLASDNTTIESNHIQNSGVYFTPIDFQLEEAEAKKIKEKKVLEIVYTIKNKNYNFKTI